MKKLAASLRSIALFSLATPFFLIAEDRIEVKQRPSSTEVDKTEEIAVDDKIDGPSGSFYWDQLPVYSPSSLHQYRAVSAFYDSLEIEDGSRWRINPSDSSKIAYWPVNTPIVITPNTGWFTNYDYKIINKLNNQFVEANLFEGPIIDGPYTRYVIGIEGNRIYLNDQTHWDISYSDRAILQEWRLNDTVIIGVNTGWFSSFEAILINVNMNDFVRAHQF